jgi:TFIIF-interacting CTD phosphatase-like protein
MLELFRSSCQFHLSKSANKIWIHQRPYLQAFLEEMSSDFTLILFTAGHNVYADAVLKVIDPQQKYFKESKAVLKDLEVGS